MAGSPLQRLLASKMANCAEYVLDLPIQVQDEVENDTYIYTGPGPS